MWRPTSYFYINPEKGYKEHKLLAKYRHDVSQAEVLVLVTEVMYLRAYTGSDTQQHKQLEDNGADLARLYLNLLILEGDPAKEPVQLPRSLACLSTQ